MHSTKKIRKSFKKKKDLTRYLLDEESDLEEYILEIPQNQDFPLRFSDEFLSKSLGLNNSKTQVGMDQNAMDGHAIVDFILHKKTSWQLKFWGVSAKFGICIIKKNEENASPQFDLSYFIDSEKQYPNFSFGQGNLMNFTYYPSKNEVNIFNTFTKKSMRVAAPDQDEDYDLCPAIIIHKASAFLQMDYILNKQKSRKMKENQKSK